MVENLHFIEQAADQLDRLFSEDCRMSNGGPFGTFCAVVWRLTRSESVNWQDGSAKWEGEVPEIRGGLSPSTFKNSGLPTLWTRRSFPGRT